MHNFTEMLQNAFNRLADHLFDQLAGDEAATISLHGEDSLFLRLNQNKVRQNTHVKQRTLSLMLQKNGRTAHVSFSITGNQYEDFARANHWLAVARRECDLLPKDPFQVPLQNNGTSDVNFKGSLLPDEEVIRSITAAAMGTDMAGLYCGGPLISANKNSLGQSHWFSTENFFMDYSIYSGQKAVKGVYAGTAWNQSDFIDQLHLSKNQLRLMEKPKLTLKPQGYRTYLAPAAVAELASMFYWGALSYTGLRQGNCALQKLAMKEKELSPLLSIRENYALGLTHRFNSLGELSPERLDLISEGKLNTLLISNRSAKEYGVLGNAADPTEAPRALEILAGELKKEDILKRLGTGLYLSNLHYLNWSDRLNARITGMTRYACFWVENGEIVAPIADLRFDESLYDCLGVNLEAITTFQEVDPMVSTYESRSFGGKKVPGMLIKDFKFTL